MDVHTAYATPTTAPAQSYVSRARRRAVGAGALEVGAWLSIALAIALWLGTGAWHNVAVSNVLTQLGIVAGLTATDTCLLMLLLAARIPIVDAAIGHDRALLAHRALGFWTVLGLVFHGAALVIGFSLRDELSPIDEFTGLLGTGDLLLAVLSLALFFLVGVSSWQVARRKLGQEAWHAVHLLSYVAVGISIPHQFSQGIFAQPGLMRFYWASLFIVTGFALVSFRLVLPLITSLRLGLRVVDVRPEGQDAVTITMQGRHLDSLTIHAGQFCEWRFLARGLWWHSHPFSISAAPGDNTLRITVRNLGAGTAVLQHVQLGTRVHVAGPYGLFSSVARATDGGAVLIGAGIGIAPIRAVLEETSPITPTTVILRAHDAHELYLIDEVTALCHAKGAKLFVATGPRGERGWLPRHWPDTALSQLAPQTSSSDIYVCGPDAWMESVIADARAAGARDNQIHAERFSW